jgi:hypothetical protein
MSKKKSIEDIEVKCLLKNSTHCLMNKTLELYLNTIKNIVFELSIV